ncbi:hypothetical protein RFEPED_1578 [Rickettsia felis str. Pedreira]|uniref:Uncharacterized protein n=1 Tax=Rickettsia felis str. Pedreira TaxID=1359196 RepID=A0A0F3MUR6_RICFI|nr:hypothetical protein RFEPED_1578 [Rickettsia felis str. Pedreira]
MLGKTVCSKGRFKSSLFFNSCTTSLILNSCFKLIVFSNSVFLF